jgi:hypothetical protein
MMRYLLLAITCFSLSRASGSDVPNSTKWAGNDRMQIRITATTLFDGSEYIIYEVTGPHDDDKTRPELFAPDLNFEFADGNGSPLKNIHQVIVDPAPPKQSGLKEFCTHGPLRGVELLFISKNQQGVTVIRRPVNETDGDDIARYETTGKVRVRLVYSPPPARLLKNFGIKLSNYIDQPAASEWLLIDK